MAFLPCTTKKGHAKFSDAAYIIVVVGARGSGKGKFIDFIKEGGPPLASNDLGASKNSKAVDKTKISDHRSKLPGYGSSLVLIFTPGYEETGNVTLASTLKTVQHELKDVIKSTRTKIGVIFTYDIRNKEVATGIMPCLTDLRNICNGKENLGDRVMMVTTFWDTAKTEDKRQQYDKVYKSLKSSRQWQTLDASVNGLLIEKYDNTEQSAFKVVSKLLQGLQSS